MSAKPSTKYNVYYPRDTIGRNIHSEMAKVKIYRRSFVKKNLQYNAIDPF